MEQKNQNSQFPTPKNQTLQNWLAVLDEYTLPDDTIFIGHSLGVPFVLNVLEKHKAKGAFLVAGFTGIADNQFDEGMKTFAQRTFEWDTIKQRCKHFVVFHSDNDPYLSLDKGQSVAKHLAVDVTLIKDAGHFNTASGYTTFPLLLEKIKALL